MTEMPPILSGSEKQQLAALRDYLVRLSSSLDSAALAPTDERQSMVKTAKAAADSVSERSERKEAELRALIIKTADTVQRQVDTLSAALREEYLAISDFGEYTEQIDTLFTATARNVVESYDFYSRIDALTAAGEEMERLISSLRGELRRGIIEDPDTGERALGIAISENLSFTGEIVTENGVEYYRLSPGQTLGIYTSSGWQFWINGAKRGWFDSRDGMLHVGGIAVESSMRIGADWLISCDGGFGIRYLK